MNKNLIIAFLGIAVAVLVAVVFLRPPPPPPPPPSPPPPQQLVVVTNTIAEKVTKNDVECIPAESDAPQEITSIFEAKGKGTYAKWGGAADADIYYMLKLVAKSEVKSKEPFESGRIRVEEIRSFKEATEVIKPAKVNLRVDLSILPLDQIENTGYLIGGLISLFDPKTGLEISTAVQRLREQVDSMDGLDGKPVVEFLQGFGIDIEKIVNEPIEAYLNGLMNEVHSHVNAVQGKSYRFVYWTDKEGEPLRVRYENVDHSPISVEEQNVLNYVNLFIDCHVLPDRNCQPGARWKVDAKSIASMFGAVVDGVCSGDVEISRGNDLPDGNWDLTVEPTTIPFYSADKRPIGNVKIDGGKAKGDARRAILREFQISGRGKLRKKETETKWWFYDFVTKIEGDCEFRSTLMPRVEE